MAPASSRNVGRGRVGTTTRAGRSRPGTERSRSRLVATTPAVEPAETTAAAWPRRTSWQATATLERGPRHLANAPSSLAKGSSAGGPPGSPPRRHPTHVRVPGNQSAQLSWPSSQDHRGPHRGRGGRRAGHHHGRAVVAAHGVDHDGLLPGAGRRGFLEHAPKPLTSGAVLWTRTMRYAAAGYKMITPGPCRVDHPSTG